MSAWWKIYDMNGVHRATVEAETEEEARAQAKAKYKIPGELIGSLKVTSHSSPIDHQVDFHYHRIGRD